MCVIARRPWKNGILLLFCPLFRTYSPEPLTITVIVMLSIGCWEKRDQKLICTQK